MKWYVIHTKPRQERRALENLENQDFEVFCPMIKIEKIVRRKLTRVTEPMFSRYIFIKLDLQQCNWSPISSTLGVSRLVRFGSNVTPVENSIIEAIRVAETVEDVDRLFQDGDQVLVISGPLKGLEGIFCKHDGEQRAMVLLDLLGKQHLIKMTTNELITCGSV